MDAFDYNTEMARAEYLVIDSAMKLGMYDVATAIRIEWSSSLKTTIGNARTFWRPPSGLIKLSMDLWARAGDEQRTETIIHEAAHILANLRHKAGCGHDNRWRQVMAELGYPNATRCHDVDTEGLRRRQTRYKLPCPCGKMHTITSRWRTKAMRDYGPGAPINGEDIMREYWVLWTYLGNYGGPWRRMAESPKAAAKSIYDGFSADFKAKGTVFVFDTAPVLTVTDLPSEHARLVHNDIKNIKASDL